MNRQDTLIILAVACFVVFVWVMLSVYHAANTSTLSESVIEQTAPIQPSFDQAVISSMQNRIPVDPVYEMSAASGSAALNANQSSAASAGNMQPSLIP